MSEHKEESEIFKALDNIKDFIEVHPHITGTIIMIEGTSIFIIFCQTQMACVGFGLAGCL